jgi:DNA replication protein DnaC
MIEQTKQLLGQMKFLGMLETVDLRITEATSQGWGHTEFLSALITDEKLSRENRQIKSRIRVAQFRTDGSMESLDLTAKRNISKTQVSDLMELSFIKAPRNVLILGPTGVGKTYLATAIGNWACRHGFSCVFAGMSLLIERLSIARADGTYLKYRDKLVKTDLLILDDLGIKPLPPETVQDIYDVLEERYQSKSTIVTSQLPLNHWKEVIEDAVALEAILDRLIHGAVKIELDGESYRKKRGDKKKKVDTP